MKNLLIVSINLMLALSGGAQNYTSSYQAGDTDVNGKRLGGSEIMQMVTHKGAIYATVSYWEDGNNPWYGGKQNAHAWGQVVRLDKEGGKWQEDLYLEQFHLRPEVIKELVFTQGPDGKKLQTPDTVLLVGAYTNLSKTQMGAKSYVRVGPQRWEQSWIFKGPASNGHDYSIRDVEVFQDPTTKVERVYISVGTKGVFEGVYDRKHKGKIRWNTKPALNK